MRPKIFLFMLFFLYLASEVSALGIAPAQTSLDYSVGKVQEGRFRIIADTLPMRVIMTKDGDLADYIELENKVIVLTEPETWIEYDVNIGEGLGPGEKTGRILVLQIPENSGTSVVLASVSLIHKVKVDVPFPGKYAEGKVFVKSSGDEKEPAAFTIVVQNIGKERINDLRATINVKGPTNNDLGTVETGTISLEPGQEDSLNALWQPPNIGTYYADITIDYDGKLILLSKQFNVGSLELEIERIMVNDFRIGQIAKLDIYLMNKWNKEVKVEGNVDIFKDDELVSSFTTIPVTIGEMESKVMEGYWNTQGLSVGEYDILVRTQYDGKQSEKTFTSVVSIDKFQVKDYVSGKVISDREGERTSLLVVAVVILILFNIFLFIYIRKKLGKRPGNA